MFHADLFPHTMRLETMELSNYAPTTSVSTRWNVLEWLWRGRKKHFIALTVMLIQQHLSAPLVKWSYATTAALVTINVQHGIKTTSFNAIEAVSTKVLLGKETMKCVDHNKVINFFCKNHEKSFCVDCMAAPTHKFQICHHHHHHHNQ